MRVASGGVAVAVIAGGMWLALRRRSPGSASRLRVVVIASAAAAALLIALLVAVPRPEGGHHVYYRDPDPPSALLPPSPPPPTVPSTRRVWIESVPSGAVVAENGSPVCITPCGMRLVDQDAGADHALVLTKNGFKTKTITVGPADEKVKVPLVMIAPVPLVSGGPLYKTDFE